MTERLTTHEQDLLEERLRRAAAAPPAAASVPRRDLEGPTPLSFAQNRLWFFDQLLPRSPLYNICFAARLRFRLDGRIFKRALQTVVQRHEVLRTVFATVDEEPVQVVLPTVEVPISAFDLSRLPPARREHDLARLSARFQDESFDLARGPLIRVMLARLAPADYVLVIGVHHIVADGWSLGVLARELETCYEATARGRKPPLDELEIQYGDFASWQRTWLAGDVLAVELSYWRERLSALPVLDLPTDRPRPPVQAHRGSDVSFVVPKPLLDRLARLGRERGATLFMVALAAFDLVLSRWSGQEDVVVGAPIANRNRAEIEPLIGFFVNTLVLRVDISGNPTFAELLDRVRATAVEAYAHQDLPFEKLVEELKPERDLSRNPLVQVILQLFESAANPDARMLEPGITPPTRTSLFDLRVDLAPAAGGLSGRIEYDVDLFERATIERLAERFVRVLEQVAENPHRPLSSYELVTPHEHRLLDEWNATAAPLADRPVHELVAERAARLPEAVAIVDVDGEHSYAAIESRSNQLAHELHARGIGPGSIVGICLPRDAVLVTALLGVLKAGAAFLPLESDLPTARLAFLAEDSGTALVLTTSEHRRFVPDVSTVLELDGEWPAEAPTTPLDLPVSLDAGAWLLYTSGSSGLPKGVLGSHRGLVNRVSWGLAVEPFEADDVCCFKTRLSFVDCLWELLGPLVGGARLVVADEAAVRDPRSLAELLVRERVTRLVVVPSFLAGLLDVASAELEGSRLRSVACSGEVLSAGLVRELSAVLPRCRVANLYGSTEVTADATWFVVEGSPAERVPIGRPLANVWLRVLGRSGELVPIGAVGELLVGGPGLAVGYVGGAAAENEERFVADPLRPGERLYRTGDLVRWRADAVLEFVGRADRQVKVRGVRVEPAEVERVLAGHEAVREAAVVPRPGPDGGVELVGFVVLAAADVGLDAVRAFMRARLPEPLMPAHLVPIERLPRLPSGKLDRTTLAKRPDTTERTQAFEPPATDAEQAVADVYAELTNTAEVGRYDDFFVLGGHSLLATRAVARLSDRFGKNIPLRLIFEHGMVAGLADAIGALAAVPGDEPVPIVKLDRARFRATVPYPGAGEDD